MYYVVYGFLWLFSLLPLRVLYLISDFASFIISSVVKYRRDIVLDNLRHAFPTKSEEELLKIAKRFYRNLTDTFIETIKMLSVSDRFLEKHFSGNWEVINNLKPTGRKVQVHMGHNFNWEWGNAVAAKKLNFPFIGAYMPLKNKIFERLFYELRSKSGTLLVRATKMGPDMLPYRNTQYMIGLVADQNPGHPASGLWFHFLGRPAPFLSRPAKYAIANDCAVVFAFIHKKKRGYYEIVFELMEEKAETTTEIALTTKFVHYMQHVIETYPDMWLWSHRRWKHKWKEEYGPVLD